MNLFPSSVCLCLFTLLTTPAFAQGSLTPPGPPGATMKTLEQTEPRTPISSLPFNILQPGSYYLTTNLVATVNSYGIVVRTNDVTIDLNGFALSFASNNLAFAITTSGLVTNVTVRNGIVRGWHYGIGGGFYRGQFLNLQVSHCTDYGIRAGAQALVKQCSVSNCGSGFDASAGSTITDCVAANNGQTGFDVRTSTTVLGCRAVGNQGNGFLAQESCVLVNCTATGSTNGFLITSYSTMANCSSSFNHTNGIRIESGSIVRDCNIHENPVGIRVGSDCRILNNTLPQNYNVGILVTGSNNTLDGNQVTGWGTTGIQANPATGNLIIRNHVSVTTDFNVSTNNTLGPIITTHGTVINSNPWANFAF